MSERLTAEYVESAIDEMWQAFEGIDSDDPECQVARKQAEDAERKLRERLRRQDALDLAAPKLLEALKQLESDCQCTIDQYEKNGPERTSPGGEQYFTAATVIASNEEKLGIIRTAIAAAEGGGA